MCNIRENKGFTLIEVLIALTLLVILSGALYGTYFSVINAREKAGARVDARREISTTLGALHRELASAYFASTLGLAPKAQDATAVKPHFVVLDRDSFGKPASVLQFTSVAPPRVDPAPASDVVTVRYLVKEKEGVLTLTRESKDFYQDARSAPYPVIDVIDSFLVECYDGGKWVRTWDTELRPSLPDKVRVTITLKGGESFTTIASPHLKL